MTTTKAASDSIRKEGRNRQQANEASADSTQQNSKREEMTMTKEEEET